MWGGRLSWLSSVSNRGKPESSIDSSGISGSWLVSVIRLVGESFLFFWEDVVKVAAVWQLKWDRRKKELASLRSIVQAVLLHAKSKDKSA